MDGYLLFLVIFLFLSILYIWYRTREKIYSSDHLLALADSENRLVQYHSLEEGEEDLALLAQRVLLEGFSLEIEASRLELRDKGEDRDKEKSKDQIIDLRRTLGISAEIIIHPRGHTSPSLCSMAPHLRTLLDSGRIEEISTLIKSILKDRTERLQRTPAVKAVDGSYAYLSEKIPQVESITTAQGERINLLCREKEFLTLERRLEEIYPGWTIPSSLLET